MPPEACHHAFIPWPCDAGVCYREHPSVHYAACNDALSTWTTPCPPSPIYPHLSSYYKGFTASFLGIPQSSFSTFRVPFSELFQKHTAMIKQI